MSKIEPMVDDATRSALIAAASGASADDASKSSQGTDGDDATSKGDDNDSAKGKDGSSQSGNTTDDDEAGKSTADDSGVGEDASLVITALSKYIEKDGDSFVLRPMEFKKEDGTVVRSKTFYRGKTQSEVIDQIFKGIVEKDTIIDRLKGDGIRNVGKSRTDNGSKQATQFHRVSRGQIENTAVKQPDIEAIRAEVVRGEIQRTGFDTRMLSFTEKQWDDMANEKGDWRVTEARQEMKEFIKAVNDKTQSKYNEQNAMYANSVLVESESQSVADFIEEFEIDITPEEYANLLQDVLDDEKNYTNDGMLLKPGMIQLAVARKFKGSISKKDATVLTRKIEDDIKAAEEKKKLAEAAKTSAGKGAAASKTTEKQPKTVMEAGRNAVAEYFAMKKGK